MVALKVTVSSLGPGPFSWRTMFVAAETVKVRAGGVRVTGAVTVVFNASVSVNVFGPPEMGYPWKVTGCGSEYNPEAGNVSLVQPRLAPRLIPWMVTGAPNVSSEACGEPWLFTTTAPAMAW